MKELAVINQRVDAAAIHDYAAITGDFNPIHVDPAFAATTPLGGVIAHGTLSMNLLWQLVSRNFGDQAVTDAELDIRFSLPVRVGDNLTAGGTQRLGQVYDVWVRNQNGLAVIEGTLSVPGASDQH